MRDYPTNDYGAIMVCQPCGYRAPFYLFLPAIKYPGMVRCPECKSDKTKAEGDNSLKPPGMAAEG